MTDVTPLHERLRFLAEHSHAPGEKPYTQEAIRRGLERQGERFSRRTISNLFNGYTLQPSDRLIEALADFFHVSHEFFYEDEETYQANRQYILHIRQRLDNNMLSAARTLRRQEKREQKFLAKLHQRKNDR